MDEILQICSRCKRPWQWFSNDKAWLSNFHHTRFKNRSNMIHDWGFNKSWQITKANWDLFTFRRWTSHLSWFSWRTLPDIQYFIIMESWCVWLITRFDWDVKLRIVCTTGKLNIVFGYYIQQYLSDSCPPFQSVDWYDVIHWHLQPAKKAWLEQSDSIIVSLVAHWLYNCL